MTDNVNATLKLFGYITPQQYQAVALYHAEHGFQDFPENPRAWDQIFTFRDLPGGVIPNDLLAILSDIKRDPRCRLGFVWGYAAGETFGANIEVYDAGPTAKSRSYMAWEGGIVMPPALALDADALRQAVADAETANFAKLQVLADGEELPPAPLPVWRLQVEVMLRVPGAIEVTAAEYDAAVQIASQRDILAENFIPVEMTEESQFAMFREASALRVFSYATEETGGRADDTIYEVHD